MITERILGLDIGDRYIGIAVSDPLGMTAQPYRTYKRGTRDDDISFFSDVIEQFNIKKIVCGLPLNSDGSESSQSRKTQNFVNFLKNRLPIEEVIYINEELTSNAANEVMDIGEIKGSKNRKQKIDTIAAQIILTEYMNNRNRNE